MRRMEKLHFSMMPAIVSAMKPLQTFQVAIPCVRIGSWRSSRSGRIPCSSVSLRICSGKSKNGVRLSRGYLSSERVGREMGEGGGSGWRGGTGSTSLGTSGEQDKEPVLAP